MKQKEEGFWYDPPKPNTFKGVTKTQRHNFVRLMGQVETKLAAAVKNISGQTCLICDKPRGTMEYTYRGWTWPDILGHYIKKHKVAPSPGFIFFIMEIIQMEVAGRKYGRETMEVAGRKSTRTKGVRKSSI